ncbi:hypothetical protein [Streptomyces sp. CBMA156]|uniref:hypothetical protein n=1 Tax=Streptomyces sp. CBMA156 TaxID=1930280 RepID=UPI001661BB4A|nr:hypothetical protein [Streptomyces sp. CBMA156]MBD0676975.1 hypothetical protein [Streptomyces sp. CBMA156]
MSQTIPDPAPTGPDGRVPSPALAATWQASLISVLLLVSLLTALIALLFRGMTLEEAIAALGAGGLLAAELRRRLLE